MNDNVMKVLEGIRERYLSRMDGSSTSGNWGHVGRIGERGGSAPGGGGGYSMGLMAGMGKDFKVPVDHKSKIYDKDGNFTGKYKTTREWKAPQKGESISLAKLQQGIKHANDVTMNQLTNKATELRDAGKESQAKKIDSRINKLQARVDKLTENTNARQKSVRHLKLKGTYDEQANKNMLSDKEASKSITERNGAGVRARGTKETINQAFPTHNQRGGH